MDTCSTESELPNLGQYTRLLQCDYSLYAIITGPLAISDLYWVNATLVGAYSDKFGRALGIKPSTLEVIKSQYSQNIERCFTEVLASWLNRQDRPHNSPDPNWGEVVAALKSVGRTDLADQLVQKLTSKLASELGAGKGQYVRSLHRF
jgi:hypothetical protein